MKTFRKIIFWLHLVTGSIAGLVIFTMCVTGMLLAFEKQIVRFAERHVRFVTPAENAKPLPVSEIFNKLQKERQGIKVDSISMKSDPSSSITFATGRESVLYIDPYSGRVVGEGSASTRKFFRTVTNIHRWLVTDDKNRDTGRVITGICNAAFLILAISGLYLWWPDKWIPKQIRAITWFQPKLKARARDFNWHNVIGFWCAPILIVVTLTAVFISYQWATNLIYAITGDEKPPSPGAPRNAANAKGAQKAISLPQNIDQLWLRTQQQAKDWHTITMRLPPTSSAPLSFIVETNESINPFARSELSFDAKTGEIIKWQPYGKANTARKIRVWIRGLHTGEALRLPGQIFAFVATTGGAFLFYTGISLAIRRLRSWQKRRLQTIVFNPKSAELQKPAR